VTDGSGVTTGFGASAAGCAVVGCGFCGAGSRV
jgi:hypothetical protein